jgi:hypothetical protein
MSQFKRYLVIALLLLPVFLAAQNDLNNFVVERKNVQKQLEELLKTEKAFKSKTGPAELQTLFKRLLDLDEQIILSANYSLNILQREKEDAVKKGMAIAPSKTIIKTVPSGAVHDSLTDALYISQNQVTSMTALLHAKNDALSSLMIKSDSLIVANKKLESRFQALMADHKLIEEKNLVLIVLNSLVVLGLILALFFLLRKPVAKKILLNPVSKSDAKDSENKQPFVAAPKETVKKNDEFTIPEPVLKISSQGIVSSAHDVLDFKLDQIEKLARLKEKGYLTEDEFSVQKKQILGN